MMIPSPADSRKARAVASLLRSAPSSDLRSMARGQHVGHGLHEVDVVAREHALARRVDAQHGERLVAAAHEDGDAADHAVLGQEGARAKAVLGPQIVHDDRFVRKQRVAGLGLERRARNCAADRARPPSESGGEHECAAVGRQLAELTEFSTEREDHRPDGVILDAGNVGGGQRELSQLGDGRLLAGAGPQLGFDQAAAGFTLPPEHVFGLHALRRRALELRDARAETIDFRVERFLEF